MVLRQRFGGWLALAAIALTGASAAQVPAPASATQIPRESAVAASRVKGDWRSSPRVRVGTGAPVLAGAASVVGAAPSGARLDRMLLLLEPATAQRQGLDAELASQQNPKSS